jgi:hypothetical protein
MFKKLFNAITGNDQTENTPQQNNLEKQEHFEDEDDQEKEIEYNPETLHGTHYSETDFDAEVAQRAEKWIAQEKSEDPNFSKKDEQNIYFNYRRELYCEWNQLHKSHDQMIRFEHANSLKYSGIATSGFVKEDGTNPLLEPIHGISLKDYAAMAVKMSSGIDYLIVCKAMGIEPAIWEELNTLWPQRMAEDTSFTVTTLYGQYFMEGADHPKLNGLQANVSEEGKANLEKIKTDQYFYEELCGARQAAYEYGMDGAQWILDNFGIALGDFQAVAMKYMTERNQDWNSEQITTFANYQQEKQKEYAAKFAAAQGGNVADDVDF